MEHSSSSRKRWRMLAALVLAAAATLPAAGQDAQKTSCSLQAGPKQTVARIIDAETVLLDDGREVRLIGALAPRPFDMRPDAEPWPPEEEAKSALRDLVLGREVELAFGGRRQDRYGRLLAHLFLDLDGGRIWVQGRLLARGHARAYGVPGSFACMPELLAHERAGRDGHAGIWSRGTYAVRSAGRPAALMRLRNTYQIIAGRVAHVAVTKANAYLNFGRDWRRDFTAGIDSRLLRKHAEWAKSLAALEGRRVEVRGWIEYRNGPFIRVEDPSQIAVIDEGRPEREPAPSDPTTSSQRREQPSADHKQERPAQNEPGAQDLDL